ncbi:MAG: GDYXXLXY domain-containing protein [Halopseudomonas sp.]
MIMTRRWPALLGAWLLVMVATTMTVIGHERTLRDGQLVLLELAPVDPRSLMQGDYMALDYALNRELEAQMALQQMQSGEQSAYALLAVDEWGRTSFVGLADAADRADDQVSLRVRQQGSRFSLGPDAFFFQEGTAGVYQQARWGGFRVAENGTALLVSLHDEELKALGFNRR